jgi:hypothetical protein
MKRTRRYREKCNVKHPFDSLPSPTKKRCIEVTLENGERGYMVVSEKTYQKLKEYSLYEKNSQVS